MKWLRTTTLICAASTLLAPVAWACAFHGYTPRPTLVDLLYDSEQIVLARLDPSNPARFTPVQALAGGLDLVELPQTPDATLRKQLIAQPNAAVLFARDGSYGPWVQHSVVDPALHEVLITALTRQNHWQGGPTKDRAQFFADQLTHPSAYVRELALLELDRADYPTLRGLRIKGLAMQVTALNKGDPKLQPIRILLAGLAGDAGMSATLSRGLQDAVTGNRRYLGAYTTALIELGGPEAVTAVTRSYLALDSLPADRRELMIEAFAIQGLYGSRRVKREVRRNMTALLQTHPELAAPVARQFSTHSNWTLAKAVDQAQANAPPAKAKDAVPIARYLAFARQ